MYVYYKCFENSTEDMKTTMNLLETLRIYLCACVYRFVCFQNFEEKIYACMEHVVIA